MASSCISCRRLFNLKKKVRMKNVTIIDESGNRQTAILAENSDDVKHVVTVGKKASFKERLYTGYLIVGTLAFALGIYISLKRLNGK